MKRFLLAMLCALLLPPAASGEDRDGWLQTLVVAQGETADDVFCFFCFIRIDGTVTSDVVSLWGSVEVNGSVASDVIAIGGSIRLGPNSHVGSDAIAFGGEVERAAGATLTGAVAGSKYSYMPGQREVYVPGALAFTGLTLGLALFAYAMFRARRTKQMMDGLRRHPLATFLIGAGFSMLAVLALQSAELFGDYEDKFAYFLLLAAFLIALPGFAALSHWLGELFLKREGISAVAAGGLLFSMAMILPLAGLVVCCLLYAQCAGTTIVGRFGFGKPAQPALQEP